MENRDKSGNKENKQNFNPFPGLRPFTPEESKLFFGREGQSDEILEKLKRNRFITVIGASGSGKSSLIYCGIIPKLLQKDRDSEWKVLTLRPGNDPVGNMVDSIARSVNKSDEESMNQLEAALRSGSQGLDAAVDIMGLKKGTKILFMIDQFEELFRFKDSQRPGSFTGDSKQFVNLLVNAINKSKSEISIIITMRSDFIGECSHFQGLTSLINSSNYLLPHMSRENYYEVITGPVKYAGGSIDEELTNSLLDEIGNRVDQLPVLQHALMRTWSHCQRPGHTEIHISKADYDSVGQMKEAMSRHADEAFEELDARGKEICEVLFKTITEKGSDNRGLRHPTKIETIASVASCSNDELYRVIDVFRLAGRSFLTPGPAAELTPETVIDVSHESLMRLWDRLAVWVEEEAASVQMYLRLSESSEMFQQGKASLWRPPDLQLAINWRNDNKPTLTWAERYNPAFERAMVYLETSEKEYRAEEENKIKAQKRQLRRSRITAIILGTAAIISVLFMLYAFVQQIEAENQKRVADAEKQRAEIEKEKADSSAQVARRNEQLANTQTELAIKNQEQAEYNAAVADTQRIRAESEELKAKREEQRANEEAERARLNEQEALENEAEANKQRELATRRRMVATGKTMAVKSLQVEEQGDLQALLAYQAYLFNARNGGRENDADIYLGLYKVNKSFGGPGYRQLNGHDGPVQSISFMPEENILFTSGTDGKIIKWNLDDGQQQTIFEDENQVVGKLVTSSDGKMLAAGSDRSDIVVFPTDQSGLSFTLKGHSDRIRSLAFTPDNRYLYSSAIDGSLFKWDLQTRQHSEIENTDGFVKSLDVSPNGKILAAGVSTGAVRLFDVSSNEEISLINNNEGSVEVVRFRDDGTLALGYLNGKIEFWDVASTTVTAEIKGHDTRITDIRFNTKKKQMASSSLDTYVKLWNLDDLVEPPVSLNDNGGHVLTISFSPDGRYIVSGSDFEDGEVNLLARLTFVDNMVSQICNILHRNFTRNEWKIYVGDDIEYEFTCPEKDLGIGVEQKKKLK
ncbi:MAG: hypothetical protein V2I37_03460 [Marinilabiliaceae bacterium]|jgi:dipeptidyl aminopeptidase/acylaminoacyl peptidase|nr:hypothetical protein [Marinilabiliaceae bacterium]